MSTDPRTPKHEIPGPEMNITCPHCQVGLSVDPSQAGSQIACPKCSGRFQVPLPTAQIEGAPHRGEFSAPMDAQSFASKKIAAGICGILLGGLGVHKFILGLNTAGAIMLAVFATGVITGMCVGFPLLASAAMNVIGLIEGIIYLTKSDQDFYQTYAVEKKEWF